MNVTPPLVQMELHVMMNWMDMNVNVWQVSGVEIVKQV